MYLYRLTTYWTLALILVFSSATFAQQTDTTATDTTAADTSLVSQLKAEMSATEEDSDEEGEGTMSGTTQRAGRTLTDMNPEISLIGDFRSWYTDAGSRNLDVEFHHLETAFISDIDPYARAEIYVGAHPEEDGGFHFGIGEAFAQTLSMPYRLQGTAGIFRSNFGKINKRHPHSLPYIGLPLVYRHYLGHGGMNDAGVSLSWLSPAPFYQQVIIDVTSGPTNPSFQRGESNQPLIVGRLENFWDLSQSSTLELGFNYARGNNVTGYNTNLGAVDATYIWKPVRYNTYQMFKLQSELFLSNRQTAPNNEIDTWGLYVLGQYQIARRWFLTGRFDYTDRPTRPNWDQKGVSATLAWYATEFQKIELGMERYTQAGEPTYQAIARLIFVIGAHGAHEY